jgi:ubiquinone/menaquinone biosynthesis C-methylase UbiE
MQLYEWNEDLCRHYADGLRPMVRFDHAPWAAKIALRLAGFPARATVLDVATGPGFLLVELGRCLPGARLIAQDQAEPMLAIARGELERAGLCAQTVCCPAEHLEIGDASTDIVVCKQLLHEAAELDRVLAEVLRVLKPAGRAFFIDFDADGSRGAALAVRTLIRFTRGRSTAHDFWRSFEAGLRGADVRARMLEVGFADVEYVRSGFNYLLVGTKGT